MPRTNYSFRDTATVANKLGDILVFRKRGRERKAYVVVDGRKMWPVSFPNQHGSQNAPSRGIIDRLIDDLQVSPEFFKGLVDCPKRLPDYLGEVKHLIERRG